MKKKAKIFLLALGLAWLIIAMFARGGTSKTYNIPFSDAAATLLTRLQLDPALTITQPDLVQAKADDILGTAMSMKLYAVDLQKYERGETLSLLCRHVYNIGASGGEFIRFRLRKKDSQRTHITVDYSDRWYGMWFPFVFWNPGTYRERNIHNLIWESQTANQASEFTARKLAEPQR